MEGNNIVPKRTSKKTIEIEDKQLRDYELVLIISPEVEGEGFDAIIENVNQFVTGNGGSVSDVERWGKRRLAYSIEHFAEGNYVLTRFTLKPSLGRQLEANLQISEEILRHLLIRLNG